MHFLNKMATQPFCKSYILILKNRYKIYQGYSLGTVGYHSQRKFYEKENSGVAYKEL